jgi:hypothetical protein
MVREFLEANMRVDLLKVALHILRPGSRKSSNMKALSSLEQKRDHRVLSAKLEESFFFFESATRSGPLSPRGESVTKYLVAIGEQ